MKKTAANSYEKNVDKIIAIHSKQHNYKTRLQLSKNKNNKIMYKNIFIY